MSDENKSKAELITELAQLRQRISALETAETKRKQAEEALRASEKRYRTLFEDSPISLWEEDFSEVKSYFDRLQASGIEDLGQYFQHHPGLEMRLAVGKVRHYRKDAT